MTDERRAVGFGVDFTPLLNFVIDVKCEQPLLHIWPSVAFHHILSFQPLCLTISLSPKKSIKTVSKDKTILTIFTWVTRSRTFSID